MWGLLPEQCRDILFEEAPYAFIDVMIELFGQVQHAFFALDDKPETASPSLAAIAKGDGKLINLMTDIVGNPFVFLGFLVTLYGRLAPAGARSVRDVMAIHNPRVNPVWDGGPYDYVGRGGTYIELCFYIVPEGVLFATSVVPLSMGEFLASPPNNGRVMFSIAGPVPGSVAVGRYANFLLPADTDLPDDITDIPYPQDYADLLVRAVAPQEEHIPAEAEDETREGEEDEDEEVPPPTPQEFTYMATRLYNDTFMFVPRESRMKVEPAYRRGVQAAMRRLGLGPP